MNLFGRSYETVGKSSSDFCIKTKGQVKIQWGSKFIDLIKDGKVNADVKFIYRQDEVGSKDGIYVSTDGSQINLVIGGEVINLMGEAGTTYVSFLEGQEASAEQKYNALTNIGFIYKTLSDIDDKALQNGIIYVESEQKLYTVVDGVLTEFTIEFPNPYPKQLIIQKSDSDKGALLINGTGIENSLAFDSLYIYSENQLGYINAEQSLNIRIGANDIITISPNTTTFNNTIVTNEIQSPNATSSKGYRLYIKNGESTLEVDNLIVRNGSTDSSSSNSISPQYWYYSNNIVSSIEEYANPNDPSQIGYAASLVYENQYQVGDTLYIYVSSSDDPPQHILLPLKVEGINTETENTIYVSLQKDYIDPDVYSALSNDPEIFSRIVGQTIFQIGSNEGTLVVPRISKAGFDILNTTGFEEEIISRVGDLTELKLKGKKDNEEVEIKEKQGIYTKNFAALQAQYTSDYDLPADDKSTKFASTEWVQNLAAPVDIDFTTDVVDFNIENYLNQSSILELINDQEDNTSNTYKGYHGQLTVVKVNGVSTVSGMIRGILKDGSYSYRTINGVYDGSIWEGTSSYIIKDQFNPGYYWSKEQLKGIPISPTYVGTTHEGFITSKEKYYLWYTNDGDTWSLIEQYVEPESARIYIAVSQNGIYRNSDGSITNWPAGYVCYHNGSTTVENAYGKTNYISAPNSETVPDLSKMPTLTSGAVAGYIPSNSSYKYIWSIASGADRTVLSNWRKEASYSSSYTLNNAIEALDWTNLCAYTSNQWVNCDSSNKLTSVLYPNTTDNTEYWAKMLGTLENWQDKEWRQYFLRYTIGLWLKQNEDAYDESFGFAFSWAGPVYCTGWGGYWSAYIGEIADPTSDTAGEVGYTPTPTLYRFIGEICNYGYKISFYYDTIKIGKRMEGVAQTTFGSAVGSTVNFINWYDIGEASDYIINFTDMSTGTTTVIKKSDETTTE